VSRINRISFVNHQPNLHTRSKTQSPNQLYPLISSGLTRSQSISGTSPRTPRTSTRTVP